MMSMIWLVLASAPSILLTNDQHVLCANAARMIAMHRPPAGVTDE